MVEERGTTRPKHLCNRRITLSRKSFLAVFSRNGSVISDSSAARREVRDAALQREQPPVAMGGLYVMGLEKKQDQFDTFLQHAGSWRRNRRRSLIEVALQMLPWLH